MSTILLIGTGTMAVDYARVLTKMNEDFVVVGRGVQSAEEFNKKTGIVPAIGGIEIFLQTNTIDKNCKAIIATGTESLMGCIRVLIKAGVQNILVEKPGALSIAELLKYEDELMPFAESIYLGYNRRFYASVIETKRMTEADGGLLSMSFEFTEWAHKIEPLVKAPGVKENWFFANSTHVVDLAFYLAGAPLKWKCYSKTGKIDWHEKTNFSGAGITENGVLFSYLSNWESAGRWAIELLTDKRRIYLKPLENIFVQAKGTITVEEYAFDNKLDIEFKPGLFLQVKEYLKDKKNDLLSMKEHIQLSKTFYSDILN